MTKRAGPTPAQRLAEDFLRCKAIGHALYDIEASRAPSFGYLMLYRCERCGTVRHDIVDRHGTLAARWYDHPDGYREVDRLTRAEYRALLLERHIGARALRSVG